jgi:protein arginine N-methyltransferase 1
MYRYSPSGHGAMLADDVRVGAYVRAIRAAVRPGDVVVEIGTGTGLFAMVAAKAGARRVYAIETDDIIEVARSNAAANGCTSIEFLQAISTQVTLPERADVIISDLRGVLPLYEHHLTAVADARRRFLRPGGRLVPQADRVWLAGVEAGELHAQITAPWSGEKFGLEMAAAHDLVVNDWRKAQFGPGQMVTEPACCATIDYSTVDDPGLSASVTVPVKRAGIAHGLCLWFDTTLEAGIGFTTSPDASAPASVYGHAFFPWPEPIALGTHDQVSISIRASLAGDEYLWTWETQVRRPGESSDDATHFRQSSFFGASLSPATLRRRASRHVARIDVDGRVDHFVLGLMDQELELGEIARQLASRFPDRFARWEDALSRVGELSLRYGR